VTPAAVNPFDATDDHELMRLLAVGQREALSVLVRRHQGQALALAYRFLGRWDVAEDVCQEAFIRVMNKAGDYQPTAAFTTWLYRIVVNLCWDRRRQAARDPIHLTDEAAALAPAVVDPAPAEQDETQVRVRRAIAQLPDRQRLVLVLHRYNSMSHKEICTATGWSTGAVESCLVRAYQQLRRSLSDLND
jgi:RNA polymerase sigma-70 factor, ECF subfamily